ncbi:MAG TPA: PLP-dependent aminotransferase family protein [Pseudonocardiaceae bacterium]|jgi:2-aminoadipate transaminase|nr:PLP-dependent aminotransferase family protein [Pseudonocardiaceae bacterium]
MGNLVKEAEHSVEPGPMGSIDWTTRLARRTTTQPDLLGGILALANAEDLINFSGGFPDPSLFPTDVLGDIARRLLTEDASVALQYAPSEGIRSTRQAVADRLLATDGHRPADGELMITSGGIDAVTLLAKSMLDPGDTIVVEEPSYLGAVSGFTAFDARLRTVPVDEDGLDVDALGTLLSGSATPPKLLYLIPDFQNPSGRTLSADRRRALVALCRRHGVLLVEDVAYSQLGFDDTARPTLWSLGPDVVVQIGTFSKVFFPGVRLGWAAGPAPIIAQLAVAKQNSDQCAGALGQRMLEEYLRGGHLDEHLPTARAHYRSRATAMTDALTTHFTGLGSWTVPHGGFFSWVRVPGVDTAELSVRAREANVAFVPGAGFFAEHADHEHLRLSYSRVSEADIDRGIARLAAAVRRATGR